MDETVPPARSRLPAGLLIAGLLASLGVVSAIPARPVAAQDRIVQSKPMEVTTDTPEYCLHLLDRVSQLVRVAPLPVPHEVTDLTTEGHRMCADGQTRGGIMRLRSALMMMENGDRASYR